MSRPQKMHKPLRGSFSQILAAVALGNGKGKTAALKLARTAKTAKKANPKTK